MFMFKLRKVKRKRKIQKKFYCKRKKKLKFKREFPSNGKNGETKYYDG